MGLAAWFVLLLLVPRLMAQGTQPGGSDAAKKAYSPFPELRELKRTNPKEYERRFTRLVLDTQMALARFGYGTRFTGELDPATRAALKEFQAFNHMPATGDLDVATWSAIDRDDLAITRRRDSLPEFRFFNFGASFSASGAWFENDKSEPTGPIEISCDKDRGYCVEAWVLYGVLQIDDYRITRWDNVEIVAEQDNGCARTSLTIGFPTQSVLHTAMDGINGCTLPNLKPRLEVMKLGDGRAWWLKATDADWDAKRKIIRVPDAVRVKTEIFGYEKQEPK